MFTFLIGGARSGKSALALEFAHQHVAAHGGRVAFLATSPHIAGDADLEARIEAHRRQRPAEWTTVEAPYDLTGALAAHRGELVIVDCLTLWLSNLLWRGDDDAAIARAADAFAAAAAEREAPSVVVSNEVGLGVHPSTEAGRRFRDVLGRVNQTVAAAAATTLLMVAGRALALGEPRVQP
jgi:adenosylcobinamide kinase / adenosylcobinamide-phosphate guanylyltransferase